MTTNSTQARELPTGNIHLHTGGKSHMVNSAVNSFQPEADKPKSYIFCKNQKPAHQGQSTLCLYSHTTDKQSKERGGSRSSLKRKVSYTYCHVWAEFEHCHGHSESEVKGKTRVTQAPKDGGIKCTDIFCFI